MNLLNRWTNSLMHFKPMRYRKLATILSVSICLLSMLFLILRGLNLGLDFVGGAVLELHAQTPVDIEVVRTGARNIALETREIIYFGSSNEVLVRTLDAPDDAQTDALIASIANETGTAFELVRRDVVGPSIGEELRDKGGLAMLLALGIILLYVAFRFQFKFGVAAVAALAHDILIVIGVFAFTQWQFDLSVLAAILAVIGYSLNDTIVVSDRIREYLRESPDNKVIGVLNASIVSILGRTFITSITTLLVLFSLLIFGGEALRGFALALITGVLVGTYSSIYVAASILLGLKITAADVILPDKEGEEYDLLP